MYSFENVYFSKTWLEKVYVVLCKKCKYTFSKVKTVRSRYYITTLVMARVLRAERAKSCGTKKRCQYSHEAKPSVNTDTEFFSRKILRVQHSKRVPSREWLYL